MSQSGTSDAVAAAAGKVTEALETIERARLHDLGHADLAQHISDELIGRNVLPGRWSFQVVDEYDDGYYRCFQEVERLVRNRLTGGRRHVHEAQLKEHRRTAGHPAHAATPDEHSAKE